MQYHLNGYNAGDPAIAKPARPSGQEQSGDDLPDRVDVLIVGSGPAGLTLAAQLAAFPEITTRIIDQKPGRLMVGQADGIACRTMEMFEAFGFSERVLREAYWVNETCFWKPDDSRDDIIVRSGRIQDTEDGLSEFPHVILNQARVHDFYLDVMRNAPTRLEPDYGCTLVGLRVATRRDNPDGAHPSHPVTVTLERTEGLRQGEVKTVLARYVVGCDGARSGVRKALGRPLRGDSANQAWGVMDILAVTDFPDIRMKAAIHSGREGSLLIIPREGGYLVRLYIELDKLDAQERVADRNITIDRLIAVAQRILHPYTLDVKEVAWWSVYEIGQRLCDKFDDVPEEDASQRLPAVFIAGDACHTHSPKAGQGMNVSMQDGFNLGWKLASVLRGHSSPAILHTYSAERQTIAKELIDFDREFARMFSAAPRRAGETEGVDPAEFQRYFARQGRFTAGTATQYRHSLITAEPKHQALARNLVIGTRFHSAPVTRLADGKPMQLGHCLKADGRWRMFLFADPASPTSASSKLRALCDHLAESQHAPVLRYLPAGADIDTVIDVRAIFQQPHREVSFSDIPGLLRPRKGRFGLVDYEKAFCSDAKQSDIFDVRGVDKAKGCIVVIRPDQYIGNILPLEASTDLAAYFDAFMVQPAG